MQILPFPSKAKAFLTLFRREGGGGGGEGNSARSDFGRK